MSVDAVTFADIDDDECPPTRLMRLAVVGAGNGQEATAWFEFCESFEDRDSRTLEVKATFGVWLPDLMTALQLLSGGTAPEAAT